MRVFILSIVASVSFLIHANKKSRPPVIIGLAHSSNVWLVGALDSKRIWTDDDRASTLLTSGLSFTLITESGNGRNVIAGRFQLEKNPADSPQESPAETSLCPRIRCFASVEWA